MPDRHGPYRNLRFRLEIDGIDIAGFKEASIPDHETNEIEYRVGTDPAHQRKLWGPTEYGELELKRGVTREPALFEWREQARTGDMDEARRAIAVVIVDESGESVVVIKALDDNAMKWLYDWLEETRQYYRTEYVDASGEHDAAKELATAVYDAMRSDPI